MKKIFLAWILLTATTLFSQNLELIGGINKNRFFDLEKETGYTSDYFIDYGYMLKVGIDEIKTEYFPIGFTLGFEKYGGEFNALEASSGGGYRTIAMIDKSVFSVGFYPMCFRIIKRIDLNIGAEYSLLMSESYSGTYSSWKMGQITDYDLKLRYNNFSRNSYLGLLGRIAYDINLSDKLVLSPQYSCYFGLSGEFIEFPMDTRSLRHQLCIGIQRKL